MESLAYDVAELELYYVLEVDEQEPLPLRLVPQEPDYLLFELCYEDVSDEWFEQPEDVLALIEDVYVDKRPILMPSLLVLGMLLTAAACIATR